MDICADAVVAYLKDGSLIEDTIRYCDDIRKFIVLRGVKGGGVHVPGELHMKTDGSGVDFAAANERPYLGKAVRWYYGMDRGAHIAYKSNGNKVAGSQGSNACDGFAHHVS